MQFVRDLVGQEKVKKFIEPWGIGLTTEPVRVKGQQIPAGSIYMGNNRKFNADCGKDFDQNIQQLMFMPEPLKLWGVIYAKENEAEMK
jgi:hypothetical protein